MASEQIISLRVTQEFSDQYAAYVTAHFGDARGARSVALLDALNAQMAGGAAWLNQSHSDQKMLIVALESEVEKLKLLTGKRHGIPIDKTLCRPFQVLEVLRVKGESTAPEIIEALGGEYFDVRTAISDLRRPRNGCIKAAGRKTERGYAYCIAD